MQFKVGDPVVKYYQRLYGGKGGYSEHVNFIKAINKNTVQLAQEIWPYSHFFYAYISELKPAKFTSKAKPDMWKYRDQAIMQAVAGGEG